MHNKSQPDELSRTEKLLREASTARTRGSLRAIRTLYDAGSEEVRYKIVNALPALPLSLAKPLAFYALRFDSSALVRHEAAFVIGATLSSDLEAGLMDAVQGDPSFLVRHEAAMALASVGTAKSLSVLERGLEDTSSEVAVSCRVAISSIEHRLAHDRVPS